MRRLRGGFVVLLALALVVSVGGVGLTDDRDRGSGQAAAERSDLRSRLWDAARDLVGVSAAQAEGPDKNRDAGPGLAVDEPAPEGKVWPAEKRVRELPDRRTANGRFYQLSDGRVQAEISAAPVNYRDGKGRYQPIDTRVTSTSRSGFVKGNSTNTFTSLFGASSNRLVRFEQDGRSVELGLTGAARQVTLEVDGSTVTYPGLAGGADLVYEVTPTALKEKIVLKRRPSGPVSYSFTMRTGGLLAEQRADGSIAFVRRSGGEPVWVMPAPFMYDDRDDASSPHGKVWSDKVSQRVSQMYGQTTVTVSADSDWLADAARVYPVVIDPTVKIQPVPTDAQDVQIYSGATGTNYNSTYQLSVGTDASNAYRSLVKFPLTGVPSGTQLDAATRPSTRTGSTCRWRRGGSLSRGRRAPRRGRT
jgi:hypothetical protein